MCMCSSSLPHWMNMSLQSTMQLLDMMITCPTSCVLSQVSTGLSANWCFRGLHAGKGPLKEYYQRIIKAKKFSNVQICTMWLSAEDYPLLLGTEIVAVYVHWELYQLCVISLPPFWGEMIRHLSSVVDIHVLKPWDNRVYVDSGSTWLFEYLETCVTD